MALDYPYHAGELAVQKRAGESRMARMNGAAVSDHIPGGAMRFIEQQPMAIIGSLDSKGHVWASVLFGIPGFLHAEDSRTLALNQAESHAAAGDPLWDNLKAQPQVGLLLIELESRRRLRVNGNARYASDGGWFIDVKQAYPNCPKYIQGRRWRMPEAESSSPKQPCRQGEQLNVAQQAWIGSADTLFVASAQLEQGVDASHRGGRPGFVKILSPHRLRIPDFAGNGMFNTLGNFASYPHAGLMFVEFERGRILQLTGHPELVWGAQDELGQTGGTERYWEFEITAWRESESPLRLEWEFLNYSPSLPASREARKSMDAVFQLQVERVWRETGRIKGFQLCSADGGPLPAFEPGAHLPLSVRLKNGAWVWHNYSLLSDPADNSHYRIGVLAELNGRGGSLYLHESVRAGDMLKAMPPRNGFPLETNAEHSILLAGGIGITPLLSMQHAMNTACKSFELHYSAKRLADLAFRETIERLAGEYAHFYASDEPGVERLDLQRILAEPAPGIHFYVCGPRPMLSCVRDLAQANGWPMDQIHFESFGAASTPQDRELTITLAKSGKTLTVPASRSILDALLDTGLAVPHDCKRGECSLCITQVLDGKPEHRDLCLTAEERSHSMCVCVSRAKTQSLTLVL